MTKSNEDRLFHVLRDGLTVPALAANPSNSFSTALVAHVARRGDRFWVSDALIELTEDRYGDSVYRDLSAESQIRQWGEVRFAEGDTSPEILAELEDEAATEAESLRLEQVRQAHRYGRRHASELTDKVASR